MERTERDAARDARPEHLDSYWSPLNLRQRYSRLVSAGWSGRIHAAMVAVNPNAYQTPCGRTIAERDAVTHDIGPTCRTCIGRRIAR